MTHKRFTASNAAELSKQAAFEILDQQESRNYKAIIERIMESASSGWFSLTIWSDDELNEKLTPRVIAILKRDGFSVVDSYSEDEEEDCEYNGKIISWNV